jgi:hypothetical protein
MDAVSVQNFNFNFYRIEIVLGQFDSIFLNLVEIENWNFWSPCLPNNRFELHPVALRQLIVVDASLNFCSQRHVLPVVQLSQKGRVILNLRPIGNRLPIQIVKVYKVSVYYGTRSFSLLKIKIIQTYLSRKDLRQTVIQPGLAHQPQVTLRQIGRLNLALDRLRNLKVFLTLSR